MARYIDVAGLVRAVRSSEQWLDRVDSFRVRLSDDWTPTTPNSDGRPDPSGTVEIGFDRRRLYTRREQLKRHETISVRAWDGDRAWGYSRFRVQQQVSVIDGKPVVGDEVYALLGNTPARVAMFFLADLSWGRAGPHDYWWVPAEHRPGDDMYGSPDDYRSDGETTFRGRPCHALSWSGRFRTLYVGVEDGRLYGIREMDLDPDNAPALEAIAREHAVERGMSGDDFEGWMGSLDADRQASFSRGMFDRAWPLAQPRSLFWYDDYREVSPGCWFPMSQGYDLWDARSARAGDPPRSTRSQRVLEIAVNEPLPAAWFSRDWKPGVPVNDFSAEPLADDGFGIAARQ